MQIRIDENETTIETTLARFLDALQSVAENDDEFEAVLFSMLDENRIHFVPESPALAA